MTFEETMNYLVVAVIDDNGVTYYQRADFQLVWDTAYNEGQRKILNTWHDSNQRRTSSEGIRAGTAAPSPSVSVTPARADIARQAAGVSQNVEHIHEWVYIPEDNNVFEHFRCRNCLKIYFVAHQRS